MPGEITNNNSQRQRPGSRPGLGAFVANKGEEVVRPDEKKKPLVPILSSDLEEADKELRKSTSFRGNSEFLDATKPEKASKMQSDRSRDNSTVDDDGKDGGGKAHQHSSASMDHHNHCDSSDPDSRRRRSSATAVTAANKTDNDCTSKALAHVSSVAGPEVPAVQPWMSHVEIPDEFYDRLPPRHKIVTVVLLSFCSFLAPVSSTALLPAVSEIAAEFHTTGSVINVCNAIYMLFMGLSPVVWGPLSEVYGRRWITISTSGLFLLCSIATALTPNLAAFFVFRVLTAFEGTAFVLVGSAAIGDIYRPTERATAVGWFLMGTLVGPALGPFLGGVIVTYRSWRVIFWMQTALAGVGSVGTVFLLPETIYHRKIDDLAGFSRLRKMRVLWHMINPLNVIRLYCYPNLAMAGLASSALIWNMYGLLTPIRYVLNPRFGLTTPMQSGLIYLAPGLGYVGGTIFGGRYADYEVRRWIIRRGGERVPEDRLRSALPFMGVASVCVLVYAWCVDQGVGGIPVAVVMLFLQGVAQLFCFPSLNTYCLDVMQSRGSDAIAGNYFVRFVFAGGVTAVVLPGTEAIGVGWFNTISALFVAASAVGIYATILWGRQWRESVDAWRDTRHKADHEVEQAGRQV